MSGRLAGKVAVITARATAGRATLPCASPLRGRESLAVTSSLRGAPVDGSFGKLPSGCATAKRGRGSTWLTKKEKRFSARPARRPGDWVWRITQACGYAAQMPPGQVRLVRRATSRPPGR